MAAQVLQVLCDHVVLLLDKLPDLVVNIIEVMISCLLSSADDNCVCSEAYMTPCGLQGCKNYYRPTPFPGRMSLKATKPGSLCRSVSIGSLCILLFIRATFVFI